MSIPMDGQHPSTALDTEQDLVRRLRSGDHDAYRAAVERYSPRMLAAARPIVGRVDAEDIVQDTWLTVLTRIDGFEGRSALGTWLVRITTNRAISHLRSRSREAAPPDVDPGGSDVDWFDASGRWATPPTLWNAGTPEELLSADALRDCIDKHLALMPVNQRAVVAMRDLQQREFDDICNDLGLSASNVRVLLHRGRLRLVEMINGFQETGAC